jgi:hypothetical protein
MCESCGRYFEGRIHHVAPPFILSLLYISIASAFMQLGGKVFAGLGWYSMV